MHARVADQGQESLDTVGGGGLAYPMSPRRSTSWPTGAPCWVDVTTSDIATAQAFYSGLLGWTFGAGDPQYGGYCMAFVGGDTAAGMAPAMDGVPPAWTLYFESADIEATAAAVTANGGSVAAGPMDIGPMGAMLVATDPTGAPFGFWQSGEHTGIGVYNQPGGLFWEDLRSSDPDAARAFYGEVAGWVYAPVPMAGPDYTTFHHPDDEAPLGGLGGMMGMDSFPSHWIVYFGVEDTDAAVAYAKANGGHVISPGFDTPFGRMASLADPFGASFWVMAQAEGVPQPDREG